MNEWDKLEKECDGIERSALSRVQENYDAALRKAIQDCSSMLNTIRDIDSGKIKPPKSVADGGEEAFKKWRRDYVQKLAWREGTAAKVANDLQAAGVTVPDTLRDAMKDIYQKNFKRATSTLEAEGEKAGLQLNFHQLDKRQLDIVMDANEGVFTKIAYDQFENAALLTQRLQDTFFQASVLGDDRKKIIQRIRDVTGYEYKRAKRIAQTERTRVQSQARYRASEEAKANGVEIENTWSCAMMPTSRDTHRALDGKTAKQGEWFELSDGDRLRYPGDPAGKACNVINCYCVLVPHVMQLKNEEG